MTDAREVLNAQPRVNLGFWPTPLHRCDRARAVIGGQDLWIKRDDQSGLAGGGNKTRKLEFLLGRALAEGADGVVTFGALQSNHARQTAAACARVGLTCDLILTRAVARSDDHYDHSGNLLLDRLLGATVHVVDDVEAAADVFHRLTEQRHLFTIGPGGSDATGVLGYVAGAIELADQARAIHLEIGRICLAASTGGTAAGLVLGLAIAGLDPAVEIACVYEPAPQTEDVIRRLIDDGAALLGCAVPERRWFVRDDTLGDGYGIPTDEALSAIDLMATTEGILLDPVYTSKAFAALASGPHESHGAVVFLHTGGAPGLFAYTPALAARGDEDVEVSR